MTGLPGPRAFRRALGELIQSDEVPRVAYVHILHLTGAGVRLSASAVRLVRRRLALQLDRLAHAYNTQLYSIDVTDFGLVGTGLSPHDAESLGGQMTTLAGSFAPSGSQPLEVVMGHAGAEVATDLPTLPPAAVRNAARSRPG